MKYHEKNLKPIEKILILVGYIDILFEEKKCIEILMNSADKLIVIDAIFTSSLEVILAINAHTTTVIARINLSFLAKV